MQNVAATLWQSESLQTKSKGRAILLRLYRKNKHFCFGTLCLLQEMNVPGRLPTNDDTASLAKSKSFQSLLK